MRIEFEQCYTSDHTGPTIAVYAEDKQESFKLGVLAQKIWGINGCAWHIEEGIRIPLVMMDEIGLAITYKKEAV